MTYIRLSSIKIVAATVCLFLVYSLVYFLVGSMMGEVVMAGTEVEEALSNVDFPKKAPSQARSLKPKYLQIPASNLEMDNQQARPRSVTSRLLRSGPEASDLNDFFPLNHSLAYCGKKSKYPLQQFETGLSCGSLIKVPIQGFRNLRSAVVSLTDLTLEGHSLSGSPLSVQVFCDSSEFLASLPQFEREIPASWGPMITYMNQAQEKYPEMGSYFRKARKALESSDSDVYFNFLDMLSKATPEAQYRLFDRINSLPYSGVEQLISSIAKIAQGKRCSGK